MEGVDAAIAAGASINAADKFGFTALHLAIKNKNVALANKLLENEGIAESLSAKTNKGFTPLLVAAWKGDLSMVQKLITKGADLKAKDTAGRNVWGVAHDWHHEEVCSTPPPRLAAPASVLTRPVPPPDSRAPEAQRRPLCRGRRACLPAGSQVAPRASRQDVSGSRAAEGRVRPDGEREAFAGLQRGGAATSQCRTGVAVSQIRRSCIS